MVIPLQWALHMDPDVWEDPEEFRPTRFIATDGNLLKPQEFIPFQTGNFKYFYFVAIVNFLK